MGNYDDNTMFYGAVIMTVLLVNEEASQVAADPQSTELDPESAFRLLSFTPTNNI